MEDCYRVLGVKPSASAAEIKRAFRQRAKELHPDIPANQASGGDTDARMRDLIRAYETLSDPARRAAYLRMYGNICYDTRDQYVNFPWSSERK